ncbi:CBU_0592 family membrane protein [Curtobacterium sp. Leaf183]|uniref:CBU_0592 family membrane protein n=1 Tax=Curtobacterium sp. Leaf183 TaxID=1736291 RepID=UPI0012E71767|nr:hypothetical protein [Curtobacterium sp. Leaf183]
MEFLGWFGAVTVLAGYILFSTGKLPNGPVYQLFNLVGGVSVAINVAAHHAVPSTIVNGIWAIVAVVVLVRMARARRAARRTGLEPTRELHAEPPATTAVLPVIGPAVHAHDAAATAVTDATPSLQDVPALTESERAHREPAAPMTASVPVITATIALALVSAAQEQHRAQRDAQPGARRDDQQATAADRVG